MTRQLPVALAATVASGMLYALAFPPLRIRPLAWVALVPFFVVLRDAAWGRRLALGVFWTLVSGWSVGTWMPSAVATYFDQPFLVGVALFLIVTGCMAAPYYAAAAVAYAPLTRFGAATPLLVGAAWAAAELARGRLLNGTLTYVGNSPWATLGYSQTGFTPLVQIAAVTGVYGVSFVVAAVNAGLAEIAARLLVGRTVGQTTWVGAGLAFGAAVLAIGGGAFVVARNDVARGEPVPIAIVQGNLGAAVRWSAEGPSRTLETYQRLTRDALTDNMPRIVLWPEAALTSFVEQDEIMRHSLALTVDGHDAELVIGAPRAGGAGGAAPYTNSVYLVGTDGTLGARYDKQYLLPFMEYFPLRLEWARRHFGRVREFSPGAATPPLPTRAGAAGLLICNEAFLPHVASARVAGGATYLVSPSNDSWVPDAGFAWQQFEIAAMRAVEQRRYVIRVSDSGPSGVVDPFGRIVAHTEPLERAVLQTTVAPITERSLYGRVGDLFGVACALVTAAALALSIRRR
ncbi:MAG: apolipoprotein N-acyltransferase [Candidatus Binatia bacterium]